MVSEINRRLMAKTSKFPLLPATKVVSIITISEMTSLNHESSTFYTFFTIEEQNCIIILGHNYPHQHQTLMNQRYLK